MGLFGDLFKRKERSAEVEVKERNTAISPEELKALESSRELVRMLEEELGKMRLSIKEREGFLAIDEDMTDQERVDFTEKMEDMRRKTDTLAIRIKDLKESQQKLERSYE